MNINDLDILLPCCGFLFLVFLIIVVFELGD